MTNALVKTRESNAKHEQRGEVMVKFGVVGYGYWGPNVVRNLDRLESAEVVAVCDKSPASRKKVAKAYPDVLVTEDSAELMSSPDIDAIAVVTPVWTHYELAKAALLNVFPRTIQASRIVVGLRSKSNSCFLNFSTSLGPQRIRGFTE